MTVVTSRRAHQCKFCDSAALYRVFLHVRYGRRHVAVESLQSTIRCCDAHRRKANDWILSERNKRQISTQLATVGRLGIDWPTAMVEFVPFDEEPIGAADLVLGVKGAA